jgi:hypothetical protein
MMKTPLPVVLTMQWNSFGKRVPSESAKYVIPGRSEVLGLVGEARALRGPHVPGDPGALLIPK